MNKKLLILSLSLILLPNYIQAKGKSSLLNTIESGVNIVKGIIVSIREYEQIGKDNSEHSSNNNFTINNGKIGSNYSIQILATSSIDKAKKEKRKMEFDGYTSYIMPVTINGKMIYRVRVGNFVSKEEARTFKNGIQHRYTRNKNIKNSVLVQQDSKKISVTLQKASSNRYQNDIRNYSIQLITTSKKRLADKIIYDFQKEGYNPYIIKYKLNGLLVYRVRLIGFDDHNSIEIYLNKLKKTYRNNSLIQNSVIMKNIHLNKI